MDTDNIIFLHFHSLCNSE